MRTFLLCVCLMSTAVFRPMAALAAPSVSVPESSGIVRGRSAAEYYQYATEHLERGQWFERAATQLQEAVRQEPENVKYRLALGCAYASRAASIAYAATFTQQLAAEHAKYPKRLAEWEKAQKDPEDEEHGKPRPQPPPALVFPTKDDNRPLRLTLPQATERIADLSKAATAEWEKAVALAKTDAERAEAKYVRGWGLRVLQRYSIKALLGEDKEEDEENGDEAEAEEAEDEEDAPDPSDQEIRKAFETATKLAPNVAIYWQSLGDALQGNLPLNSGNGQPEAIAAYRRALELEPVNASLWYRLYELLPKSATEEARTCLQHVVRSDPTNAHPLYLLAEIRFKDMRARYWEVYSKPVEDSGSRENIIADVAASQTDEMRRVARDAITFMERGNRAPRYSVPHYPTAIPKLLAAAWGYLAWVDIPLTHFARLRELARNATGYALVAAQENNLRDADRACRATIAMGYRLIDGWPIQDSFKEGKTVITGLVGVAVAAIGYSNLEKVYQMVEDPAGAKRAAAEHAAFKQRADAYRKAVQENLQRDMGSDWIQMYRH